MLINTSQSLKNPGRVYNFKVSGNIENLDSTDIECIKNPIIVEGNIMYTGDDFFIRGRFEVSYTTICSLCEVKLDRKLIIDFDEEYCITDDINHPDRYTFIGTNIDLTKMVEDNIYLNLPMKNLCSDECLGLCPMCGCNLNNGKCDCNIQVEKSTAVLRDEDGDVIKKNNPFAKLSNMFNDEDT